MNKSQILGRLFGFMVATSLIFVCRPHWNADLSADDSKSSIEAKYSRFVPLLLKIAMGYRDWGRVDDEMRWAPELCRMPKVAQARFSEGTDAEGHGKKLYSLFALDRRSYLKLWLDSNSSHLRGQKLTSDLSKVFEQVIVKESWKPILSEGIKRDQHGQFPFEVPTKSSNDNESPHNQDHFSPYAERDGKIYRADKPSGLFVMMQIDAKSSETDDGWIYGTVAADGKTVTDIGLIKSCMECHTHAPHGRLFGIDYHGL
jgi:hypothetical protein